MVLAYLLGILLPRYYISHNYYRVPLPAPAAATRSDGGKDPLLIDFSEEPAGKPLIFYLITHGLRRCCAIHQIVYHEHGMLHGH